MATEKKGVPALTPKSQRREDRRDYEVRPTNPISPEMNKYSRDYSKNKPADAEDPFGIL